MTPTNALTKQLELAIQKNFPQISIWRNNRIDAFLENPDGSKRRVRAGINGQADLSGIIGPYGQRLEIEIKVGKDEQSPIQKAFQYMIESHGGIYLICRDIVETCIIDLYTRLPPTIS